MKPAFERRINSRGGTSSLFCGGIGCIKNKKNPEAKPYRRIYEGQGRGDSVAGGCARSFRGEFSGFSGNYGAALATITGPGGGSRWPHRGRGLDLLGSVGHGSMQTYM